MSEAEVLALLPGPDQPPRPIDCADVVLFQELLVARQVGLVEGAFSTVLPRKAGETVRRHFTGRLTTAGAERLGESKR